MRVGSLFAGIGGFDLAAERAGMEVVWQSEIDAKASAVLDYHWPAVKNLGDVHGIGCACNLQEGMGREDVPENRSDVDDGRWNRRSKSVADPVLDEGEQCDRCGRAGPPRVDVLTGGFPCQDYSVAGNRGGLAGDRGALWWEYHRLITELRPTWVIGENVPGLLSSRAGRDFETIIRSLTECGYGVAWAVLDAQYFGVAQRRRRVFIVGHSGGFPRPEVLALSEGLFGHPEPSREKGQGVAASLETRPTDGRQRAEENHLINGAVIGFSPGSSDVAVGGEVAPSITARHGDQGGVMTPTLAATLTQGAPSAGRRNEDDVNLVAFAQNQRDELRDLGDKAGALAAEPGMKQQTYVMDRSHLTVPPEDYRSSVRRLTPLECERLQGFPDGWTDIAGNSDTQRYRQLGNAVAVPVVEWILRRVAAV